MKKLLFLAMFAVGMVSDVFGMVPVQSATKKEKEQIARTIVVKAQALQELKQLSGFQKTGLKDQRTNNSSLFQSLHHIDKLVPHVDNIVLNEKLFDLKIKALLRHNGISPTSLGVFKTFINNILQQDPEKHSEWGILTRFINEILAREEEYSKNYYVFYHSHDWQLAVIFDVYKLLNKWLDTHPIGADILLRNRSVGEFKDINEFMTYWENLFGGSWDNNHPYALYGKKRNLAETLLSVNLSLFGNASNSSSNSFRYFLDSKSARAPGGLLKEIFGEWGFNPKYKKEIIKAFEELHHDNKGQLIQMFIPKDKVNEFVYLAIPGGTPYRDKVTDSFDSKLKRHVLRDKKGAVIGNDIASILEAYQNGTLQLDPTSLDQLQARIVMLPDFFLAESGVKYFVYNLVPPVEEKRYKEKLEKIVHNMIHDWVVRKLQGATGAADKPGFQRLVNYIMQGGKPRKAEVVVKDPQKKLQDLNYNGLFDNLAHYKTTNVNFHSGDPLQHSAWTAQTIERWFDQDKFWTEGLDKDKNKRTLSLAGFIHDIGKGGDLDFTYYDKPNHPFAGYEYLTGKKVYKKNELDQTFDVPGWLNAVIKESNDLGRPITEDDKKLVIILAAVHWDFGEVVRGTMSPQKHLDILKSYAHQTGYNRGKVDERLVRAAILIGAADIRAARPVNYRSTEFADLAHIYMSPHAKLGADKYKEFNMETQGKVARDAILKQFAESQKQGWGDWLKSKL